ncbi:MAG: glycogen debranching N-terminal domain-containing protein [Acidobacteriaceae bacterium]
MNDSIHNSLIRLQPRGDCHSISQGRTVLTTALDGSVQPDGDQGLWVYQTRMLSRYRWKVNRGAPTFSSLSAIEQHRDFAYYIFAPAECDPRKVPDCGAAQQSIELRIARTVGEGMSEEVTLTNFTQIETSFELRLEVAADFADPSETSGPRKQKGNLTIAWKAERGSNHTLSFDYHARHYYRHQGDSGTACLHRGIRLEVTSDTPSGYRGGKIRFRVHLKPGEVWSAALRWTAQLDGKELPPPSHEGDRKRQSFRESSTQYTAPAGENLTLSVLRTVNQAATDLSALRLFDLDGKDALGPTWIPAAGEPVYVGLFGRDILFSSREAASLSTAPMRGALANLDHHIGSKIDDWRDEQPGRMVHELHTSPLAVMNYTPHGRYYGTVSGSIFYPSLLSELWRWTGDKELVRPMIAPALRGIEWADKYSRDESHFYKYQTRSSQGEKNQGWKDSGDAIVHADGSQVKDPLGTCEMQAYVYGSKIGLAEVLSWIEPGEKDLIKRLRCEAAELKQRFNDFFWMPEENYLAMGIDSHNRPIRSVASDPGHCLLNSIVDDSLKEAVARRLMADDMFSGWGVRTLSAKHPAYNPFSYHRGTVWPVENAMFVLALAECHLYDDMNRLARAIFDSAALFQYHRLPELFCGHSRDDAHPFPALYPRANSPQAWSAAGPFLILQAMLGIHPHAFRKTLFLDPHLPDWLPEIRLGRLRVAAATVDIHFCREANGNSSFEILAQQGELKVVHAPDPGKRSSDE